MKSIKNEIKTCKWYRKYPDPLRALNNWWGCTSHNAQRLHGFWCDDVGMLKFAPIGNSDREHPHCPYDADYVSPSIRCECTEREPI